MNSHKRFLEKIKKSANLPSPRASGGQGIGTRSNGDGLRIDNIYNVSDSPDSIQARNNYLPLAGKNYLFKTLIYVANGVRIGGDRAPFTPDLPYNSFGILDIISAGRGRNAYYLAGRNDVPAVFGFQAESLGGQSFETPTGDDSLSYKSFNYFNFTGIPIKANPTPTPDGRDNTAIISGTPDGSTIHIEVTASFNNFYLLGALFTQVSQVVGGSRVAKIDQVKTWTPGWIDIPAGATVILDSGQQTLTDEFIGSQGSEPVFDPQGYCNDSNEGDLSATIPTAGRKGEYTRDYHLEWVAPYENSQVVGGAYSPQPGSTHQKIDYTAFFSAEAQPSSYHLSAVCATNTVFSGGVLYFKLSRAPGPVSYSADQAENYRRVTTFTKPTPLLPDLYETFVDIHEDRWDAAWDISYSYAPALNYERVKTARDRSILFSIYDELAKSVLYEELDLRTHEAISKTEIVNLGIAGNIYGFNRAPLTWHPTSIISYAFFALTTDNTSQHSSFSSMTGSYRYTYSAARATKFRSVDGKNLDFGFQNRWAILNANGTDWANVTVGTTITSNPANWVTAVAYAQDGILPLGLGSLPRVYSPVDQNTERIYAVLGVTENTWNIYELEFVALGPQTNTTSGHNSIQRTTYSSAVFTVTNIIEGHNAPLFQPSVGSSTIFRMSLAIDILMLNSARTTINYLGSDLWEILYAVVPDTSPGNQKGAYTRVVLRSDGTVEWDLSQTRGDYFGHEVGQTIIKVSP